MVFRKLRNLVAGQVQAAVSKKTANNQPSSDDEQPEPILIRSLCSLPTAPKVPATVVTKKDHKKKRQVSDSEGDEVPISTAADKSGKRRKQKSEIQDSPDPFKSMMKYFDKRCEGIEKSCSNCQIKTLKLRTLSNSNIKATECNLNSTNKFYK